LTNQRDQRRDYYAHLANTKLEHTITARSVLQRPVK